MKNSLAVGFHLIAFAVGLADIQDAAYWKAKVSTAIAVRGPHTSAAAPAVERPKIQMHTADWCEPCKAAKANWQAYIKEHPAPFDIEWIDWSRGGYPSWADRMPRDEEYAMPAYSWTVNKQTRYVIGYPGAEKLIERWRLTQPAKK